jgi:GTP-binding protein YchF
MQLGIFGFPQVGKTSLFNLLTGAHETTGAAHGADPHMGIAHLPDERLEHLSSVFKPKKTTHASFECVDIVGLHRGKDSSSMNLAVLRPVDALAHVVRAFRDESIPHEEGPIDPRRDLENMEMELILSDLETAQKRVQRLQQEISKGARAEAKAELPLQERVQAWLEAGRPLREMEVNDEEEKQMRGYAYLSAKPLLIVLNAGEDAVGDLDGVLAGAGLDLTKTGTLAVAASAKLEMEMAELGEEDADAFMADLGLKEGGLLRILRGAYDLLGLISFYTVGDKECRAWALPKGSTAVKAAGTVHTDFQRGFIRAEVTPFDRFKAAGSFAAAREHGWLRLEGKEYVVNDGEIIRFRFAV